MDNRFRLLVKAPYAMPLYEIEAFIRRREDLILQRIKELEKQSLPPSLLYRDGDILLYHGHSCVLRVEEAGRGDKGLVYYKEETLYLQVPEGTAAGQREALIESWYRNRAGTYFPGRVSHYAQMLGVTYGTIRIKDQKSRWGSCSSKGNLNFNWRLIKAPPEISDYVVVHELCHLLHMNHSSEFWNCVEQILPDYRERKKWLKTNYLLLA